MRLGHWLCNLLMTVATPPRRSAVHRRSNRSRSNPASAIAEHLEPRRLLSAVAVGAEFRVNFVASGGQYTPKIAMDHAGDFVVVWQGFDVSDHSFNDIYARRYNSAGVAQGTEFQVNTYFTQFSNESSPSVAMDATGNFVVTWESYRPGFATDIYARRYNAAGTALTGEFKVNTYTTGNQETPSTAMDSAGDFVISWTSFGQNASSWDVYAQRYNSAGAVQGAEFRVNTHTGSIQNRPSAAMDSTGDFVITWESFGQNSNGYSIYAQRYNKLGVAQGGEFQVDTTAFQSDSLIQPGVAMDSTGNFVVTWANDTARIIVAQRYNSAGTAQGAKFQVSTENSLQVVSPAIAMNGSGNFVITWASRGGTGSLNNNKVVSARQFQSNGTAIGAQFLVHSITTTSSIFPSVAMDTAGDFVVTWSSIGYVSGSSYGIFARRYATVNHAPAGKTATLTAVVNTPYVFKTADFGFTDPNDSPPNSLSAVKFPLLPSVGTLTDNGVAVTANQFVSAADINAGKLKFTPNTNVTGGPFFLCKFQVQDNGGTKNGGANLDPTAKILYVNVKVPNHAPVGTSKTVTSARNTTYVIKTADFGFTDPNDSPPNTLLAVKITLLPSAGTLTDNGVAVTANQFISAADIAAGKLKFTPTANLSGGPFFLCKFQVEDNGVGANLDPTAKTMSIKLT